MRLAPSRVSHTDSWVAFVWGDGPRPPSPLAGLPCQALGAAVFIVAMACSMAFEMSTCRASPTVHGTWAYVHPGHQPSRPKLEHSPFLLTLTAKNLIPPCLHSSIRVILGYNRVKAATTFWHKGGMAVLMDGFTPVPACVCVRVGPAAGLV